MVRFFQSMKKSLTYPLNVMLISIMAVLYCMIREVPTFEEAFNGFGLKLPPATTFCITISKRLQLLNYPWIIFLLLPLYFGLVVLYEKGILKVGSLKEWMILFLFGVVLGFVIYAMYVPICELGDIVPVKK